MDIRCSKCGEPWEMDTLHEEADHRISHGTAGTIVNGVAKLTSDYETAYNAVSADFRNRGCEAITCYGATCSANTAHPGIAALYNILGDDLDGAAAMFEDYDL